MAYEPRKHPSNAPGRYYVNEDCLACENCQLIAPNNFRYAEDGQSYVFKQPGTPEEEAQCREALFSCPMEAVRGDGQRVARAPAANSSAPARKFPARRC